MKKVFLPLISLVIVAVTMISGGSVFAADVLKDGGGNSPCANGNAVGTPTICKDNSTGSKTNPITGNSGVLTSTVTIIAYLAGALAVVMVIVSGINMITSAGDSAGFNSARTGLIYSVAGALHSILYIK
jgi:hypothetical protein